MWRSRISSGVQDAQAAAVLIASKPGHDVVQMTCDSPADCSIPLYTPATMISHSAAVQLRVSMLRTRHALFWPAMQNASDELLLWFTRYVPPLHCSVNHGLLTIPDALDHL